MVEDKSVLQTREKTEIQIGPFKAHRHSFYDPDKIDLDVVRKQAHEKAAGRHHESTVIHMHPGHDSCNGRDHEKVTPS